MRDDALRNFAKAEILPEELQLYVYEHGSQFTRSELFARPDLSPRVFALARASDDVSSLTAWIRSVRNPDAALFDEVALSLSSEHALVCLASRPDLSVRVLVHVAREATPVVASYLLRRPDLPSYLRPALLDSYLGGLEPQVENVDPHVRDALGASPQDWAFVLPRHGLRHVALLAHLPPLGDAALRDAVLDAMEAALACYGPVEVPSPVSRALASASRRLLSSVHLSSEGLARVAAISACLDERVQEQVGVRAVLDAPSLIASLEACAASPEHLAALVTLVDSANVLDLDRALLAFEACVHAGDLPQGYLERALGQARPSYVEDVVGRLESAFGPAGGPLLSGLRVFGTSAFAHLSDPLAPVAALAEEGWANLVTGPLPEGLEDIVVSRFCPAVGLVRSPALAGVVAATLAACPEGVRETALRLLPEWLGSFPDLLCAAASLSSD